MLMRSSAPIAVHTSSTFRAALTTAGLRPSMGQVGVVLDNAVAESFFATLETEIGTQVWVTRDDARQPCSSTSATTTTTRLHSTLGYRTRHETRVSHRQDTALAA